MTEFVDDGIVRISDKDIRVYLGQCDKKFNKYPEVTLSFGETFAEKGRTITSILGAIGIKVSKSNLNSVSGSIKFGKYEDNILNKKTGNREKKVFYQILLSKVDGLEIDNINDYEFVKLENSKIVRDLPCNNEIKISDNSLDFYLGQCNLDFQSHDQLVLSTTAENIEMVKYILKILNPLGIEVDEEYRDLDTKKIYFHAFEKERINPNTGRKERKMFYRIGITKVPELFMYTSPETALEFSTGE